MRVVIASALLLAVALAGCSEEAGPSQEESDGFDDVQVEVDEQTGAILGLVVNDAIFPVPGATVKILSLEQETETDEQGRFVFNKIEPGTYFLLASKDLHEEVQTSVEVKAGVKEPPVTRLQLNRLYQGEPYLTTIADSGFFTCSQANTPPYLYSSSSCHDTNIVDLSDYGVVLPQERTFHADVGDGWQTLLWEMTWEPSVYGTSDRMGIVVSDQKEQRPSCHWFANDSQTAPMYLRVDLGIEYGSPFSQGCQDVPSEMPPEGWEQMSYFMSVRPPADAVCVVWCVPPGLALDQSFDVWHTQFYYVPAPEDWSFIHGSPDPF